MEKIGGFLVLLALTTLMLLTGHTTVRAETAEVPGAAEPGSKAAPKPYTFSKFVARIETETDELEVTALFHAECAE